MKIEDRNLGFVQGWLSTVVNIVLFALQLWVGIISHSVAMVASAWHTLSDTMTSVVVILGFWVARKPADKKHPFGHARAELISAIVISTVLILVGFNFILDSISQLKNHRALIFGPAALIIFSTSVIIKEGLARFSFWAGNRIQAKSLIADGWHHRSDAIGCGLIIIGGLLGKYFWWIDGVLGLVISFLILKAAYDIFKQTSGALLGEKMASDFELKIKRIIENNIGEEYVPHHFHIHDYLNHKEVTFHLCCPPAENIECAHEKADLIEKIIREELNLEPTIHLEPQGNSDKR